MTLIDGKAISNEICKELELEIKQLASEGIAPTLVIIQVGHNPASDVYVRNKLRLSQKLNVNTIIEKYHEDITNDELLKSIVKLNKDAKVNGILVQMPLPKHIDERRVIATIDPNKDVDCFHLINIGKLWTARKSEVRLKPCTPAGIIELLKRYNIPMTEKKAVVVGRSNIVGKPMASLLLLDDATVTLCHSKTPSLHEVCKQADILICAVGRANMIDASYIKEGCAVIDVGMNHDDQGKLCGDINFESVKNIVSHITPVPGGVGPMTVVMLMKNLIELTKIQHGE